MDSDIIIKAALFDLDGVLVQTESQYTDFWREMGRKFLPDNPHFAEEVKGCSLTQIFNERFPGREDLWERIGAELKRFESCMDYPWMEGARDFVRSLRAAGVPTAVVTSSNLAKMECVYRSLPEFPELFTRVFTAEDSARSKPAPDCYLNAARTLGIMSADCAVFEDSPNGLAAGRASGAKVVGVSTMLTPAALAPLCDKAIDTFTGLTAESLTHWRF